MHLVVNPWQVGGGWSLTDATELVVDGSVAKADPSLVGAEIWHWDAAQMSANGRAAQDGRVAGFGDRDLGLLVELGRLGESVGLVDLRLGETTHEDHLSVPGSLEDFTWWQLGDVELLVSLTDISVAGAHLVVDHSQHSLQAEHVATDNESLEHVNLSALNLVVLVLFVPQSTPPHVNNHASNQKD